MKFSFRHIWIIAVLAVAVLSAIAGNYRTVFHVGKNTYAIPTDSLLYVTFMESQSSYIHVNDSDSILLADVDSITHEEMESDSVFVFYSGASTEIHNQRLDAIRIQTSADNADVKINIRKGVKKAVIIVSGSSEDGRLVINSAEDYSLILNGITLTSSHAPAFNSMTNQKVTVSLAEGTENVFEDAKKYNLEDTLETASGCFNSMGALTFKGNGALHVTGNSKHSIYCKKSITFKEGTYKVTEAASDAIHSGKGITVDNGEFRLSGMQGEAFDMDDDFCMNNGTIDMDVTGEAAKGIKCGGIMTINDGSITATATGALKNKKGDLSYCTIMKSDSNIVINGGDYHLVNNSPGGKCISADHNLTISGGTIYTETNGDGAAYTNTVDSTDYYTSKCIAADDSVFIHRGNIQCLSTGIGGKGVVADEFMDIGLKADTVYTQGPTIIVETTDSSIVNDVEEDQRYGCPKAIKAGNYLNIYSGDIHCSTAGMGGEGIECGKDMYVYGGNLECNCYDDGINVGEKFIVNGGQIYCNSVDNDGIDSNGSITINDGIVASINQHRPNESLDSEHSQLFINGGTIFGIGSSMVKIGESKCPYYNTIKNTDIDKGPISYGVVLTKNKYLSLIKNGEIVMSLKNENQEYRSYLTIVSPELDTTNEFYLYEHDGIENSSYSTFDDKFSKGGKGINPSFVSAIIIE